MLIMLLIFIILEIFFLIKAINTKENKNWFIFFTSIISFLISQAMMAIWSSQNISLLSLDSLGIFIFTYYPIYFLVLLLIIGIIWRTIQNKNSKLVPLTKQEKKQIILKYGSSVILIYLFIIVLLTIAYYYQIDILIKWVSVR